MPNKVSELIENPSRYIPANVPVSETGTARVGISVARRLCRNNQTTRNTSAIASKKVMVTSRIETRTYSLVSYGMDQRSPAGNFLPSSCMRAWTAFAT